MKFIVDSAIIDAIRADIASRPFNVSSQSAARPLTVKGIDAFLAGWNHSGQ